MRFGKRTESSQDLGNTKGTLQRIPDDDDGDEDESQFDVSRGSPQSDSIKEETQVLLDSIRNYVRDLDDWNRDLYEQ